MSNIVRYMYAFANVFAASKFTHDINKKYVRISHIVSSHDVKLTTHVQVANLIKSKLENKSSSFFLSYAFSV